MKDVTEKDRMCGDKVTIWLVLSVGMSEIKIIIIIMIFHENNDNGDNDENNDDDDNNDNFDHNKNKKITSPLSLDDRSGLRLRVKHSLLREKGQNRFK